MDTKGILMYDESTCRLCMTQQSGVIDINSSICSKSGRIIDMVRYCYDIDMIMHDALPNLICNECALHLNVACNLKGKCLTSEKYFLDYLTTETDTKQHLISRTIPEPEPVTPTDPLADNTTLDNPVHSESKVLVNLNAQVPPTTVENENSSENTEIKYIRPNLLAYFSNNAVFELSDTDSDTDNEETIVPTVNGNTTDSPSSHECPVCPEKFSDLFSFNNHVRDHEKKICKVCKRVCAVGANLIVHFRTHCPSQKINCPNCEYSSVQKVTVCQHIRKNHNKGTEDYNSHRSSKCNQCSTIFSSIEEFRIHLNSAHHIVVQNNTEARKHMTIVSPDTLKCTVCNRKLTNSVSYDLHVKLHQQFKLKYCYVCKSSYRNNMFLHFKLNHPGLPPYKCQDHCNETFSNLKLYEAHQRDIKRNSINTIVSVPANASKSNNMPRYSLPSNLNSNTNNLAIPPVGYGYVLIGQNEPVECCVCDLKFENETILNNHIETHMTKKCKKCTRIFGTVRSLIGHYKLKHPIKELIESYECSDCGKTFDKFYTLKRHQIIHLKNTQTNHQTNM